MLLNGVVPHESAEAIIAKISELGLLHDGRRLAVSPAALSDARIIVSGGRGIGSASYFDVIGELAFLLGGAVASSRANVASGWIGEDRQVGQTSNILAPELYIALGISGTPQHLAGIRRAGYVIAINKRIDAPIFDFADFGIVGDLHAIVSELINILKTNENPDP